MLFLTRVPARVLDVVDSEVLIAAVGDSDGKGANRLMIRGAG
jgi:hypothetical protein